MLGHSGSLCWRHLARALGTIQFSHQAACRVPQLSDWLSRQRFKGVARLRTWLVNVGSTNSWEYSLIPVACQIWFRVSANPGFHARRRRPWWPAGGTTVAVHGGSIVDQSNGVIAWVVAVRRNQRHLANTRYNWRLHRDATGDDSSPAHCTLIRRPLGLEVSRTVTPRPSFEGQHIESETKE